MQFAKFVSYHCVETADGVSHLVQWWVKWYVVCHQVCLTILLSVNNVAQVESQRSLQKQRNFTMPPEWSPRETCRFLEQQFSQFACCSLGSANILEALRTSLIGSKNKTYGILSTSVWEEIDAYLLIVHSVVQYQCYSLYLRLYC